MDETTEDIRQKMGETKSQLSEKLESLELQVSESVQSTGTAVAATAEAVQETVEALSGAVTDAVQTVSHAFDLRRQIDKHPWLVMGGCAVVGYLAVEFLSSTPKPSTRSRKNGDPQTSPSKDDPEGDSLNSQAEIAVPTAAVAAAYQSGRESSSWQQLRDVAMGAMISIVQDVVARSVPSLLDYLTGHPDGSGTKHSESGHENLYRSRPRVPQTDQRPQVAASLKVRSHDSF